MSQGSSRRGGGQPPGYYDEYDDGIYDPPSRRRGGPPPSDPPTPWTTKAGYAGVGFVLGVLVAPTVRKWIEEARPKMDGLFDRLTGQAEKMAETATDFMASARARVRSEGGSGGGHDEGGHEH
jgi:hypothetical protein